MKQGQRMALNAETSPGPTAHLQIWRVLTELELIAGPDRASGVAARIIDAVRDLEWSAAELERLKGTLVRATLNAIERSHLHDSEALLVIRVLVPDSSRPAGATDQAGAERTARQSRDVPSRGWSFFLVERTAQSSHHGQARQLIELFLYFEGENRDPQDR